MTTIQQLPQQLKELMTTEAEVLAKASGFVQRRSKLDGSKFAQSLVWGWLQHPDASLSELTQRAALVGVRISPQGLDERFTPAAATFLQRLLAAAMEKVVTSDPVAIPLLARFTGVYVQDSTVIALPAELHAVWPGVRTNQGQTTAALKVQVRFDYRSGTLDRLELQAGREQDRAAALQQAPLPPGSLRLADCGYFALPVLRSYADQHVYFLTRVMLGTQVSTASGATFSLAAFVAHHAHNGQVDALIQLGKAEQLPCRLVAWRVSALTCERRRRQLRQQARKQQRPINPEALALAEWAVFVTNLPQTLATVPEIEALTRVRWQIELLFKLWKAHGRLAHSRSHKPWRILCEVYAKLLALLIQHWLLLATCWSFPDRSLTQAAQTLRHFVALLATALDCPDAFDRILVLIRTCLALGCRINKRRNQPATFQRLLPFP